MLSQKRFQFLQKRCKFSYLPFIAVTVVFAALMVLTCVLAGCSAEGSKDTERDFSSLQSSEQYYGDLERNIAEIRETTDIVPDIAIILGSGLGPFADSLNVEAEVSFSSLSNFPPTTNASHEGKFIFANINGLNILCIKGRLHYYEGYSMQQVVKPIRIASMLGAESIIITNAVGSVNESYNIGDFAVTKDLITDYFPSPLIGEQDGKYGSRFVSLNNLYDATFRETFKNIAANNSITMHEGVFVQDTGPQFETPAQIKKYRAEGADYVGMSSGAEAIVAKQMGMRIANLSLITNLGAGIRDCTPNDEEVAAQSKKSAQDFSKLVGEFLTQYAQSLNK